jgi:hypothetical protein
MIYIFEFFRLSPSGGGRVRLATETRDIRTAEAAWMYARGAIANVHFNGSMADGCIIRSQKGMVVCEVKREN